LRHIEQSKKIVGRSKVLRGGKIALGINRSGPVIILAFSSSKTAFVSSLLDFAKESLIGDV
jgi:hypothetical protein